VLKALSELMDQAFGARSGGESGGQTAHTLDLATALLLVEVARADYRQNVAEDETIESLLRQHFDLDDGEISLLVDQARSEADQAASLQEFTRMLHEQLSVEEKHQVVEMLWRVALADSHLDKHEDHLIRRIAGLLYVSHSDLIRIRNNVYSKLD
jgi:uncharacterized tellurite resistance protein B-like protein